MEPAAAFVGLRRKPERFDGLQIVTYALMSNHFHVLVREPLERLSRTEDEALWAVRGALGRAPQERAGGGKPRGVADGGRLYRPERGVNELED